MNHQSPIAGEGKTACRFTTLPPVHARPAALFVPVRDQVQEHNHDLERRGRNSSAASLLQVLTANLDCGARVILEAIGPDEQEAINELEALLLRFRDEEGWGSGKLKVTAAAEERQLSQNTLTAYRVLGSN